MKFRNIFLAGLSAVALASCSDYLDVDAPSKLPPEYVYTDKQEVRNALNGVYAAMLSNDTYGQAFLEKLCFNTDVDFNVTSSENASATGYRRYECTSAGGDIFILRSNVPTCSSTVYRLPRFMMRKTPN